MRSCAARKNQPPPDEMIIDGYVMLGNRPGLGQHLFNYFNGYIPVIGVAKSKFKGSTGTEIFRGGSTRPLYITSSGVNQQMASEKIRAMHGANRIPTLLKRVDSLARKKAYKLYQRCLFTCNSQC